MARHMEFDYDEKLELARDLFWEKGYLATSMHDLIDTMAINRSSLYNTFGNKHALFIACLANYSQLKIGQYQRAALQKESTPFILLTYIIRNAVEQTIQDKKTCLIVRTIAEMGSSDDEVNAIIKGNALVLESLLSKLILEAQNQGEIKKTISAELASTYILSSFGGFYKYFIMTGNKKEMNRMVDFLIDSLRV